MDYLFTHDQIEAIVHYVGLRGQKSRFSSKNSQKAVENG